MSQERWTAVEEYVTQGLLPHDEALEQAVAESVAAGLPEIAVVPPHGKLLYLLARMHGAKNILEIGTLGGYSTIWLARALPAGGRLISLEFEPKHAQVATANVERAGLADIVEICVGPALESLPKLAEDDLGPFDFIFIDADKPNNAAYFDWALKISRPGSVIIVDNVVRMGGILDDGTDDEKAQGGRKLIDRLADEPRVDATVIQTVGSKGYDGLAIAVVK